MKVYLLNTKVFLKTIWKDPVWSKVISWGIIGLIIIGSARYKDISFTLIISWLSYKVPIFVFLSLFGAYFVVKRFLNAFLERPYPIENELVGDYTFKDLYQIMIQHEVEVEKHVCVLDSEKVPDNLLGVFRYYFTYLNQGVFLSDTGENEDAKFVYNILGPRFCNYGLVVRSEFYNVRKDFNDIEFKITELGSKFHALLGKASLMKTKKYKF